MIWTFKYIQIIYVCKVRICFFCLLLWLLIMKTVELSQCTEPLSESQSDDLCVTPNTHKKNNRGLVSNHASCLYIGMNHFSIRKNLISSVLSSLIHWSEATAPAETKAVLVQRDSWTDWRGTLGDRNQKKQRDSVALSPRSDRSIIQRTNCPLQISSMVYLAL